MDTNGFWAVRPDMLGYGNSNNSFFNYQAQSIDGAEIADYNRITKNYDPTTITLLLNGQGFIPVSDRQRFNELHPKYGNGKKEESGRNESSKVKVDDFNRDSSSESQSYCVEEIKGMEADEEAIEVIEVPDASPEDKENDNPVLDSRPKGKKSRLKRDIVLTYDGFKEISLLSQRQKEKVQEGKTGGYESMLHTLKTKIVPNLIEKYKDEFKRSTAQKIRDAIYLLEFIHAFKLGDPAANKKDESLKGWAFPKDELIIEQTGITKNELPKLKKILVDERLLVIKKRKPKGGSEKDFYVPFYFPYDEDLQL
ncbi:hypothetical protein AB7942_24030 [Neobacillus sp. BF23-41]|uniref:hypothetical protein n=1 Tax=Neobacillus sp. BF23-41 TaxID=3240280 RepID=UPI0034E580FC